MSKTDLLAWAFIFAVCAADVAFAWMVRSDFANWELNPVARWLFCQGSIWAAIGFRIAATLFGLAMAFVACPYRSLITSIAVAASAFLLYRLSESAAVYWGLQ